MVYQALYRVYRPQTFQDIAGQQHITQTLENALLKQQFSHAYLFTGPRGTGKTSAAKILAKAVNCEQAPVAEPCNTCAACRGITQGSVADVIEIDAASNNGVDEIREIRDKVKYAPSQVRFKVYIIDEVHMLSTGAFNALLKTLEEPPEHVIFILATTEPQKIPLTIISRCQQFDFRRIPSSEIAARLRFVARDQHLEAEDAALDLIAKASEGGMRDALSTLDQTVAYSEGVITVSDVQDVTGMVSDQLIQELIDALESADAALAIGKTGALIDHGKDSLRLIDQLIFYYRDALLYKTSAKLEDVLSRPQIDETFRKFSEQTTTDRIYQVIERLNDTLMEMKRTNHPRILLEAAFVHLCTAREANPPITAVTDERADTSHLEKRIAALERRLQSLGEHPSTATVYQSADEPAAFTRPAPHSKRSGDLKIPVQAINHILQQATKADLADVRHAWATVMTKIRAQNVAAHAWLIDSTPVASSPEAVVQAFKHDFHCQMVTENKNHTLELVQAIVQDVTGKQKTLYPIPEEEWLRIKKAFISRTKMNAQESSASDVDEQADPVVTEAEKLVGPDLIDIKD
ncbi:MAG: DNA polymerase III subunit gamma/tau [Sporolactobacillus sp.]